MLIRLHKKATTTPAIHQATGSDYALAWHVGVSRDVVRQWRWRECVQDASHTAQRLQTTLNAAPEALVIYLRTRLLLPLDDLLAVIRAFLEPSMSRSALDRLLRRRGQGHLPVADSASRTFKAFKACVPGYLQFDVKDLLQMADETSRRYVFVAIDRATRWVYIALKPRKTAAAARSFLHALAKAAPFHIRTLLTDNGKAFTDRLFGRRARDSSGQHEFDALCESLGIEHRLIKPKSPQTNGMVERFNGRLEQVLRTHHFNSAEDLEQTLHRYVWLYNQHLPQKALNHETPLQALKRWQGSHPHLFSKQVRNHPGPDT